jgi:hypothetical protein
VALCAAALLLCAATPAFGWGPATHVRLASDLLSHLWLLPAGVAALLARHRRHFLYGNVATDTVFAKKMTRVKQVCHHWSTGFSLLDSAESDAGRAFALGYLAHLAADTVAHNRFLPRQMAVCRSTISFGHLYWEIRADALVDRAYWQELRSALRGDYEEPERLLESHLRETLFSFRVNRAIFRRMNLLASERAWRRSVEFWAQLSRYRLDHQLMEDYHHDARERMRDVLTAGRASDVLHDDPNGNSALAYARVQRRQLRQMKKARMPHMHVIREAAAGHAPQRRRALLDLA